jgi:hypothetical protein
MKDKYCSTCKDDKNIKEFNKNKSKADGLNSICRECSNKNSIKYYEENAVKMKQQIHGKRRERVLKNKQKLFEYYLNHPCVDCGESDPIVLELDHVRGKKNMMISQLVSFGYSWDAVEKEIKKCDVRCANCHRRKTAKDFNWYKNIIIPS